MRELVKRFAVSSSVLFFAVTMVLPWGALYPLLARLPYYFGYAIKYTITFALALGLVLLIYKRIPFSLKNKDFFKGLATYGLVGVICAFIAFFCSMQGFDRQTCFLEVFSFVLYVVAIVFSEELLFRGLILGCLLDKYGNDKKGALIAVLISSVIFGLRHYLNLIPMPNTIITTSGQVGFTFMAGFYLSCLYIRTENPYLGITIHLIEDLFTMCWVLFSVSAYNNQNVDGELLNTILLVLVHSIYVVAGVFMIRDKRYSYCNMMEAKYA